LKGDNPVKEALFLLSRFTASQASQGVNIMIPIFEKNSPPLQILLKPERGGCEGCEACEDESAALHFVYSVVKKSL
jgi:hypothetical protein